MDYTKGFRTVGTTYTYPTDKPSKMEIDKMINKIMKVFTMSKKKEVLNKEFINNVQLGDPVMIVPSGDISPGRSVDLTGRIVAFNDKEENLAVVVWDVPGLGLESVVETDRLTVIVN